MATTFLYIIGGQAVSQVTLDGSNVIEGEIPKYFDFIIPIPRPGGLEKQFALYCRGVGNSQSLFDENRGLAIKDHRLSEGQSIRLS
jgi:hypothetical protein